MTTTAEWTETDTALADPAYAADSGDQTTSPPLSAVPDPQAAPYGTTKSGSPRRKPGPPKKTTSAGRRRSSSSTSSSSASPTRPSTPPPGPKPAAAPKPAPGPGPREYAAAIEGLAGIPIGICAAVGEVRPVGKAHAAALSMRVPPIAAALGEIASDNPTSQLTAWLDRAMTVGPYTALILAAVPLVGQILCNVGVLPPGTLGAVAPDQLVAAWDAKAAEAAAAL